MAALDRLKQLCSEDVIALNPELFEATAPAASKRNKYNARKIEVDGQVFDSKREYKRWLELTWQQEAGVIANLRRQVEYTLQDAFVDSEGKKQRAVRYTADFVYEREGVTIIEDVKSKPTATSEAFRVRWRMLLHKFRDDPATRCEIWIP